MPDMSIVRDMVHDYAHRAVDAVTGAISSPSATPPGGKPVASSAPATDWVSRARDAAQQSTNAGIDKQIADNGG
jgi:hypothetical protein